MFIFPQEKKNLSITVVNVTDLQTTCTDSCIKHVSKRKGVLMKTVPKPKVLYLSPED